MKFYYYQTVIEENIGFQYVIIDESVIIASCKLFIGEYSAWLQDFHVSKSKRLKGVGRKFFNFVKKTATETYALESISLRVINDDGIMHFWGRLGFFITQEIEDGYYMTKRV